MSEMHVARLVAITEVENLPPDIKPFVDFRAAVEERSLSPKDRVAVLNVDTTTCYIPVFLENPPTMSALESELERQDTRLTPDSREVLLKHLKS